MDHNLPGRRQLVKVRNRCLTRRLLGRNCGGCKRKDGVPSKRNFRKQSRNPKLSSPHRRLRMPRVQYNPVRQSRNLRKHLQPLRDQSENQLQPPLRQGKNRLPECRRESKNRLLNGQSR